MANVLEKIVADKRLEVAKRKNDRPLSEFVGEIRPTERDFYAALRAPGNGFILECKKASPSKGLIRPDFNLEEICSVYRHYASCISVLTDEKYFQGSYEYLARVRQLVEQPLICKDFFIDEYQVHLARLNGADAILLMLSVLDDGTYLRLSTLAKRYNMAVLCEVSNEQEVARALSLDAPLIGINNRNLRDLTTDLATTEQLRPLIPADKLVISESGIYTHADVRRLAPLCDGFLVGSSIMAEPDLEFATRALVLGENKVCGLTRSRDAINAAHAGAVFGGLIFYPKSPRYLDLDCARALTQSAKLKYVGVFVDAPLEQVSDYASQLKLAAVQLHGKEGQTYIEALRKTLPKNCEIWKAYGITDSLPQLVEGVDRYLFDSKSDTLPGGTGKTFDWSVIASSDVDFMLAGGLGPDNVSSALKVGAKGLDLNSGIELAPGKKCAQKLAATFNKIKEH